MKRNFLIVIILTLPLFFAGCFGGTEVGDRAFVQLMGIERENDIYTVNLQIYKSEGGTPEPDVSKANSITASGRGTTIYSALSEAEAALGKKLFLGHIKLLVIGKDIENPSDELALFLDGSVSPSCPIAYSDTPAAVAGLLSEDGAFSAEHILALMSESASQGRTIYTSVANMATNTGVLNCAAALPVISVQNQTVKFEGVTFLQKKGIQGRLNEDGTLGAKLLLNQFEADDKITVSVEVNGNHAAVFITDACTKLNAEINENLIVNVKIELKTTIAENPYNVKAFLIEKAVRQKIYDCCTTAYSEAVHENSSDIFGIKKLVRRDCRESFSKYCATEKKYLEQSILNLEIKT